MRELPVDALALDQHGIPINLDYRAFLVAILNNIPGMEKLCVTFRHTQK